MLDALQPLPHARDVDEVAQDGEIHDAARLEACVSLGGVTMKGDTEATMASTTNAVNVRMYLGQLRSLAIQRISGSVRTNTTTSITSTATAMTAAATGVSPNAMLDVSMMSP